ncbi:MAG: cyclase family protein [Clostridia bacterium]|nr:cyclase family protein [Clostridia bacterium]
MFIDLTLRITPKMVSDAQGNEKKALVGHLGTHFDVMDREFPLEYVERKGIVFDVSQISDRDICETDINPDKVEANMFVAFYSGFIESQGYGGKEYFSAHPQLSTELIHALVNKNISIIGVDFAGVRRGAEHTPMDQYCADRGVFVIENLCNLSDLLAGQKDNVFIANTYPVNYAEMTGLPCRVVAKVLKTVAIKPQTTTQF